MGNYQIIIEYNNEESIYTGHLNSDTQSLEFDPTTVLAKLNYKNEPANINDIDFDDWDYEYEYGFGKKLKISNREQYYKLIIAIRKLIKVSLENHKAPDLTTIEILRMYFDITNTFIASKTKPLEVKIPINNSETLSLPLINPPDVHINFHYSNYSLDSALKEDLASFQVYIYECTSIADVVYSILHFQAICGLKYRRCMHCNTLFATISEKTKYCKQKSPYPNYTHLNCEQAVRNISQQIKRKYKRIYNNLSQNHSEDNMRLIRFTDQFNKFSKEMRKNPTPENIVLLFDVLDSKLWY